MILAIEKTLNDIGKPTYEKVVNMLSKEYHCYLGDCYDHPEYVTEILKKLFGNSHGEIVKSIRKQLEDFSKKEKIAKFIEVICK
jgi:hypothetical protein